MGIFSKTDNSVARIPRNAFPLGFDNHLTFNFGQLVPVLCKEVIPGDTFSINSAFGLQFMPTNFPVQSKVVANLHLFYVRNRILWPDFLDFYFNTKKDLIPPYLSGDIVKKDNLKSCSLLDYLNVPTTVVGDFGLNVKPNGYFFAYSDSLSEVYPTVVGYSVGSNNPRSVLLPFNVSSNKEQYNAPLFWDTSIESDFTTFINTFIGTSLRYRTLDGDSRQNIQSATFSSVQGAWFNGFKSDVASLTPIVSSSDNGGAVYMIPLNFQGNLSNFKDYFLNVPADFNPDNLHLGFGRIIQGELTSPIDFQPVQVVNSTISFQGVNVPDDLINNSDETFTIYLAFTYDVAFPVSSSSAVSFASFASALSYPISLPTFDFKLSFEGQRAYDLSDTDLKSPFDDANNGYQPLSALPCRAYECVYNAFYRDERNNPLIIDGQPEYNKWLPNSDGGADTYPYELHYKNWEQDFLTTAQPTPQFGTAPLVGITNTGTMTFNATEDGKEYQVQANVSDDGSTISSVSYLENVPNSVNRSLVNLVTSGISINDLRNVNSYQRFLETSMRRGLRALDQLAAHFGVTPEYRTLDMPEFIGGISTIVDSSKVNQMVNTETDPLGSYAGQLSCIGAQKHIAKVFCDEPGFIIGILSVTPVPLYSQLLPRFYTKFNFLDYYQTEFGKIGFQPIPYTEVAPIQAYNQSLADGGISKMTDTFGYQRPWYDYLQSVDEVHGLFRTNLRDFVLQRQFDSKPILGPSFTLVDPKPLQHIFSVTDISDKILGKVSFSINCERKIPRYAVPALE